MEQAFYLNQWLRHVLQLVKGEREGFVNAACNEGHIGKRVFSETSPVDSINSVVNFVRIICLWVNKAKYEQYEVFEHDCLELSRYTWEYFRRHGDRICEMYDPKRVSDR